MMTEIYTSDTMFRIEQEIESRYKLPPELLMEHAGSAMAERIAALCRQREIFAIDILCGIGHNGGDGYVIARELHRRGFSVNIIAFSGKTKPLTQINRSRCEQLGLPIVDAENAAIRRNTVIVDALFGIGLNRPLIENPWKMLFDKIKTQAELIIAVDTPSGIFENRCCSDPVLEADITLTVERPKREFFTPANRAACGLIETVSASFPKEAFPLPDAILGKPQPPPVEKNLFSYKNKKGHAALWAGSPLYPGAALLAARAALKTGTGLLTLISDAQPLRFVLENEPSVILSDGRQPLIKNQFAVWGCGCGWGTDEDRLPILNRFIETPLPRVIDADALNLIASRYPHVRFADGAVLTPHPGEWSRLCPQQDHFYERLLHFSSEKNVTVVFKAAFTAIVSPSGEITIFDSPVPELGVAGSGDVLTGILLSSLLRCRSPYEAAKEAVAFHNAAGAEAARQGPFTAAELIDTAAELLHRTAL